LGQVTERSNVNAFPPKRSGFASQDIPVLGQPSGIYSMNSLKLPIEMRVEDQRESRRPETPDEVLLALAEGNKRFVRGETIASHRNISRLKEVAALQSPFAVFLGCADSRVPVEIVFDQGFGDLFVNRIAGNIATPEIIGSLEFGAHVLGAKVIYVLGHTSCGAVTAAMKREPVPGQFSSLFQHLRLAVKVSGNDLDRAVRENVINQAMTVAEASPVIASLIDEGRLKVAGGVYDLATGIVTTLPVTPR
jgi:carbonic anhydrase